MPKVEISAAHLREIANFIGNMAERFPVGSVERAAVERLLMDNDRMVAGFIHFQVKERDGAWD